MRLEVAPLVVLGRVLFPVGDPDRPGHTARVLHPDPAHTADAVKHLLDHPAPNTGAWGAIPKSEAKD